MPHPRVYIKNFPCFPGKNRPIFPPFRQAKERCSGVNFKQLEALIYVVRNGTFKRAAEALYFDSAGEEYITPESIQYRIKQLEKELGVSLYRKRQGTSRVLLTREGQLFLPEALSMYQHMLEWRGMFLESGGGWLTIATTQAIALHRLLDPLTRFRSECPNIRIRLFNANAEEMETLVGEGRVDFGLSTRPPEQPELEWVLWKRSNLVLVTPHGHPLARLKAPSLAEVARYPLVLLEPELHGDRELVDEGLRQAGVKRPNIVMETSNSEIIAAYVEAGLGVGVIAETTVLKRRRNLEVVALGSQLGKTEAGLLVREGQYIPARMRQFLAGLDPMFSDWLKERDVRLEHTPPVIEKITPETKSEPTPPAKGKTK